MHIGIVANTSKDPSGEITAELREWLLARGVEVALEQETADLLGLEAAPWEDLDLTFVIVLGGDGTLLRVSKTLLEMDLPLLGVNIGRLGFLTELEVSELYDALPDILEGEYELDTRHLLRALVQKDEESTTEFLALNDVVIGKGKYSRMISVNIWVDDSLMGRYPADGVILSTATGSTAYSLSAGGPVMHPDVEVVVATPVCPHSFYARPVVLSPDQVITVSTSHPPEVTPSVTVDGREGSELTEGDILKAYLSEKTLTLLRRPDWDFYEVLRRKLFDEGNRF